jgi:hypothetical protein
VAAVLSRPSPNAAEAKIQAEQAAGKLDAWRTQVNDVPPLDAAGVRKMLAGLAADAAAHPPREWDDAAQHYLALAALYQSLTDLDPAAGTPARRDLFLGLRKVLVFPPAGEKRRYDSPVEFTPEKCKSALQPFATEFRTPDAP